MRTMYRQLLQPSVCRIASAPSRRPCLESEICRVDFSPLSPLVTKLQPGHAPVSEAPLRDAGRRCGAALEKPRLRGTVSQTSALQSWSLGTRKIAPEGAQRLIPQSPRMRFPTLHLIVRTPRDSARMAAGLFSESRLTPRSTAHQSKTPAPRSIFPYLDSKPCFGDKRVLR